MTGIDSAGVAVLARFIREARKRGSTVSFGEISHAVRELFSLMDMEKLTGKDEIKQRPHIPFLDSVGLFVIHVLHDLARLHVYIGRVFLSILWSLSHPGKIRWGELIVLIYRVGARALPIVGLMSMLVGLVTAFSAAVQLRQFGANIYIANLVGVGMTREMGPLMAAILLAGRSGSAFAAEIGTMKISDELDALTLMNIPPMSYLIIPRILAMMLAMPLLTLFADMFGILGGMLISMLSLDLTPIAFMSQLERAIGVWDVFSGVLKSLFFGIIIAAVGCYRGIQTAGGAIGVGKSTTSSVVTSIFLVVMADSIFVILFHYLDLG